MLGRQAKIISGITLKRMLTYARKGRYPQRDRVVILLSVKAGLRACEIARLEWSMVVDAKDQIADVIDLRDAAAKKRGGRRIPIHSDLRAALAVLRRVQKPSRHVIRSSRGDGAIRPNSVVNWFVTMFHALAINGCSSHSGRRTFITVAARNVHRVGGSLRDVQLLAGHRSIETTQGYIEGDTRIQRRLVGLI
jgi:integrase/recombinase XerD